MVGLAAKLATEAAKKAALVVANVAMGVKVVDATKDVADSVVGEVEGLAKKDMQPLLTKSVGGIRG